MKLSNLFSCFTGGAKKSAKKEVQHELQAVASNAPKSVAKDTVVISSSPVSSGLTREEALQQLRKAQESRQALAQKKELLEARQRQRALLTKAKTEKNFKLAKRLESMDLEDFNAFHQSFKQKRAQSLK